MSPLLIACLVLCLSAASAWNECAFPDVPWFALDEGVGTSYAYALAAMNGNMYSGGYTKGNFAFVGVTDAADVNPVPAATLWGDTTSNVQNLYVAEVSSTGSMTKGWMFRGAAIPAGQTGAGRQTNNIDSHSGLHAMLDGQHIAVKGVFTQLLSLPDGTTWSSASRINQNDGVPFVMSIDVSSTQGIGNGTTGWAKLMDESHPGGASVYSVDGDTNGNMIVSYKGCSGFNATETSYDAYGRAQEGATTGCVKYLTKLAAADGSEVWSVTIPVSLYSCRTITDGSFFCVWSMSAADGTLDFGNSITVVSEDGKAGVVKFNSAGAAQWASATASHSGSDLAVSAPGTLLVVIGSSGGYGSAGSVTRIDTSSGNEGNVLWTDDGGVGSHGFRGVEVTDDDAQVFVFGQVTDSGGPETLTDANGATTTLRSHGSYDVFVLAYDASDGGGRWAMDGGGTGMEYFFAMASDPGTHAVYVGGTSRSEVIRWGDVSRNNVMYNGDPGQNNPDTGSAVGSSKAFVAKLSSTLSTPSCLSTCSTPLTAANVLSGYCYIDRHCYADGAFSPYDGHECHKCQASVNPLAWSPPDTSAHCFIGGACVAPGAHAQMRQGRSSVDDPCQMCNVTNSTSGWYNMCPTVAPTTMAPTMAPDSSTASPGTTGASSDTTGSSGTTASSSSGETSTAKIFTGSVDLTMSATDASAVVAAGASTSVRSALKSGVASGLFIDSPMVEITGVTAGTSDGVVQVAYTITVPSGDSVSITAESISTSQEALKNGMNGAMQVRSLVRTVTALSAPAPQVANDVPVGSSCETAWRSLSQNHESHSEASVAHKIPASHMAIIVGLGAVAFVAH